MASNSDLFGTRMMRYREKQLYKKFLDVIEIPPLGQLDSSLVQVIKFYPRFLVIYTAKMKRFWVQKVQNYHGKCLKHISEDFKYNR
jgi:hypothetical protein